MFEGYLSSFLIDSLLAGSMFTIYLYAVHTQQPMPYHTPGDTPVHGREYKG